MEVRKDANLNNPNAEPEHAELNVTVLVHFDIIGSVPKKNLQRWLESLPEQAKVKFVGISSGKVRFEASWAETR